MELAVHGIEVGLAGLEFFDAITKDLGSPIGGEETFSQAEDLGAQGDWIVRLDRVGPFGHRKIVERMHVETIDQRFAGAGRPRWTTDCKCGRRATGVGNGAPSSGGRWSTLRASS